MSEMKIIAGPSSQVLSKRVSDLTGWKMADVEYRKFPDGESYLRVKEEVERAVIIQSTRRDEDIIVLLQLLDACEDAEKHVIIPYFGYARQDRRFRSGEPVSSRVIASLINADSVAVINIHSSEILGYFRSPVRELDASEELGRYIGAMELEDPIVISPDYGAVELAEKVSRTAGCDYGAMRKERFGDEDVRISADDLDVSGRDAVIVDDIISTGGTIREAISILRKGGAKRIFVGCIHPVLVGDSLSKIYRSGASELFATDTIESPVSVISVSKVITSYLRELHD
ncbi:MAG: ribose-phosphate diphosphokinase [Archaeoglobi archaeon]|nr:ribose-phosphate diphosphokinase [Candidatus Mnemosynella bozhongmuii]